MGSNFNYMQGPENKRFNDHSVNESLYDTAVRVREALQRETAEQTLALLWLSYWTKPGKCDRSDNGSKHLDKPFTNM